MESHSWRGLLAAAEGLRNERDRKHEMLNQVGTAIGFWGEFAHPEHGIASFAESMISDLKTAIGSGNSALKSMGLPAAKSATEAVSAIFSECKRMSSEAEGLRESDAQLRLNINSLVDQRNELREKLKRTEDKLEEIRLEQSNAKWKEWVLGGNGESEDAHLAELKAIRGLLEKVVNDG